MSAHSIMRSRWTVGTLTAVLGVALMGCGSRTPSLRLTYVKRDSSEQRMLSDKDELRHTPGVTNVISSIDSQNDINLQLFVDEANDVPGRQKVLELGYAQVRN